MVMPVTIWIMRGFVATLPPDLEAAARLDGASESAVFLQIVLPLLRPAIASVAIIAFLTSWSQFMAPLLFSHSDASQPVAVLLPSFVGRNASNLGLQAAGGILALLLPLILTVLLHKSLLGGLLGGAVK
jgi:ABC-type glycerol-3-phosphate transport system permease component